MSFIRTTSQSYRIGIEETIGTSTVQNSSSIVTYVGTVTGESVPHWRKRIANGSDATGNYTRDSYELEVRVGGASWDSRDRPTPPTVPKSFYGSFRGTVGTPSSLLTHQTTSLPVANAAALKQVYDKLAQERSHAHGLQTLGELGETIRMLKHPFKALADLTHSHVTRLVKSKRGLRGSEKQRRASYYELVRTSYLEYVFGLAPLISEMKGYAETVARWQLESEGIKRARTRIVGQGSDVKATQAVTPGVQFGANSHYRYTRVTTTTTTRKVRYVCGLNSILTAPAGSADRLIELSGFSAREFVPTIWEVLPWSWLADYVTNVGDIIQATFADTSSVAWVSKTVTEETVQETTTTCDGSLMRARLDALSQTGSGSGTMGGTRLRRTSMTRTRGVSLGIPDLVLALPADPQKYVNAFAAVFALRAPSAFRLRNPY